MPSLTEIVVILLALLVIVGPERLPQLARTVGDGLKKLRRTTNMFRDLMMYEEEESSALDVPNPLDQTPIDAPAEATVEGTEPTSEESARDTPGLYAMPLPPARASDHVRRVSLTIVGSTDEVHHRALAPPHRRVP